MNPEIETKVCQLCFREIPKPARKRPECHHFQSRSTMIAYHPVGAMILAAAPLLLTLFFVATMLDQGEDYQQLSFRGNPPDPITCTTPFRWWASKTPERSSDRPQPHAGPYPRGQIRLFATTTPPLACSHPSLRRQFAFKRI